MSPAEYRAGRGDTPLGELTARVVTQPLDLEPYLFFRSRTFSHHRYALLVAVATSALASAATLGLGLAMLALPVFLIADAKVGAAIVMFLPSLYVWPLTIPAGSLGIVSCVRFLRLPSAWREVPR